MCTKSIIKAATTDVSRPAVLPLQERILLCGGPFHMASMDSGGGEAKNGRFLCPVGLQTVLLSYPRCRVNSRTYGPPRSVRSRNGTHLIPVRKGPSSVMHNILPQLATDQRNPLGYGFARDGSSETRFNETNATQALQGRQSSSAMAKSFFNQLNAILWKVVLQKWAQWGGKYSILCDQRSQPDPAVCYQGFLPSYCSQ